MKTKKFATQTNSNAAVNFSQRENTFSNESSAFAATTEEAFWLLAAPRLQTQIPQNVKTAPTTQTPQNVDTTPTTQIPQNAEIALTAQTSQNAKTAVFREFPFGGYQSRRETCGDAETLLVFKAGPFGYPATAAHAHADALEILLHVDGVPTLIDPGTFSYRNGPERLFYRSSAQHNTLNFAKSEQSQYINRFLWGKKSTPELLPADTYRNGVVFAGRVRWHSGETHERRVERIGDGVWRIVDRWRGNEPPTIRFHFSPEVASNVAATPDGTGATVRVGDRRVEISNPELAARLEPFRASPAFYRLEDAIRLVFVATGSTGETATTLSVSPAELDRFDPRDR